LPDGHLVGGGGRDVDQQWKPGRGGNSQRADEPAGGGGGTRQDDIVE